jgi:hypothetical protein|mmetsp:Transcript_16756/g.30453  ORF Transcript_16756/g.30453 Transcript_16756/m.30453 type:complete len:147 (-) Transcript_16756:228-668(-)|eukprot:CAMPEP_0198293624 /NCGR_PEP_ID=MMETSP1449-20131203/18065_1 /TAXON_ID=420275 /ORGANISM="Attheya septentrionalis, Strain CCMP2084" /LENGTH=146 /DNA_ID=CAMNT_0043993271 /DNA_START=9 /DNA_END=449 /DNA_ORIENTATION=+
MTSDEEEKHGFVVLAERHVAEVEALCQAYSRVSHAAVATVSKKNPYHARYELRCAMEELQQSLQTVQSTRRQMSVNGMHHQDFLGICDRAVRTIAQNGRRHYTLDSSSSSLSTINVHHDDTVSLAVLRASLAQMKQRCDRSDTNQS